MRRRPPPKRWPQVQTEPRGTVRLSCPVTLAQSSVGPLLPELHGSAIRQVRVEMRVLNRPVDPVEEGVDLALRVRPEIEDSATLVAKNFGISRGLLVASPEQLRRQGPVESPARSLAGSTPSPCPPARAGNWRLEGPERQGDRAHPRAALCGRRPPDAQIRGDAGVGASVAARLHVPARRSSAGRLVEVLPGWGPAPGICHVDVPGTARAGAGGAPPDRFPGRKPRRRRSRTDRGGVSRLCRENAIFKQVDIRLSLKRWFGEWQLPSGTTRTTMATLRLGDTAAVFTRVRA